jgi:glycogen phosphorylase
VVRAAARRARQKLVAYFSAEFGITECLRIFSGGLGVLAGDHLKSASDLGVPLSASACSTPGLLHAADRRRGHAARRLRRARTRGCCRCGRCSARAARRCWSASRSATGGFARIWRADVGRVPLFLLDTNVPENRPEDRQITDRLYGGDNEHRLQQEIVLGIGGMRALRAIGIEPEVIHLNEGHAAFAAVERARR